VTITGANFFPINTGGDTWSNVAGKTLPGNLYSSQLATIGNNLYLFGGYNGSSVTNVIYTASVSDPTNWTVVGKTLPENLYTSQLAVIGNNLYLFGGHNGSSVTNVIYTASVSDPTTWTTVVGKTLPGNLNLSQLAIIGNNLYLFGGQNESAVTNVIYTASVSDPTTWTTVLGKTLPGNLHGSQLATIGNNLYLFGGHDGNTFTNVIYTASVSDPTTWTTIIGKTLPGNLYSSHLATIGNNLYLFGGHDGNTFTNVIYTASVSDPTTWTTIIGKTLPGNLAYSQLASIGNSLYLFGGSNGATTNIIYTAPIVHNRPNVSNKPWTTDWFTIATDQSNVTIGGNSATNINFANTTTITATTPAHAAGAIDVVVTNYDGQAATLTNGYTFNAPPTLSAGAVSPASAKRTGGDTITITGTGFYGTPIVTLGGTAATSVTVVNPTTITATTPAHAVGPVDVTVTNQDSQFSTLTNGFTFTELPPTVGSIAPTNGPSAGGTNVTITGTNFLLPNTGGDASWANVAGKTLPGNMMHTQIAVVGSNIYLFGGHNGSTAVNTIYTATVADPTTWSVVAGKILPGNLSDSQIAIVGSNLYLFGGYNGSGYSNVIYTATVADPTTWSVVAGKILPGNLGDSQLAIVGNNLYLFGGYTGSGVTNVIYTATVADPTTWSVVAGKTLPTNLNLSKIATVNNNLYMFGGHNGAATNAIYTATVADPTTWSLVAGKTLPGNLFGSQFAAVGDNLYLFGGHNGSSSTNVIYTATTADPTTWTLVSGKTIPGNLYYSQLAVIDNNVYLFGGHDGSSGLNVVYRAPVVHNRGNVSNKSWITNWNTVSSDQTGVAIGGAAATNVSFVNPTTITATTPAHAAGATDVVVTNYDGQAAALTNGYTFNLPPAIATGAISPSSAKLTGGDTITITGENFYGTPTVTLGGTAATDVVVVNPTTITITTPAHNAGLVDVVITNEDLQSATLTNGFTFTELPPTVSEIAPNNGPVGGGTNVTITGTNFIPPNAGGAAGWATVAGKTLPAVLSHSHSVVIGDNIYLFGGNTGAAITNVIYTATVADPTTWTNTGKTLPAILYISQLAVVGNNLYLFGGYTSSAVNVIYTATTADPTTWTLVSGKTLPGNLHSSQLAVVGDNLYLFGGYNGSAYTNVIYTATVADPTTWTVVTGKTLPGNLGSSQLVTVGNNLYLFGGYNGSAATNVIYTATVADPTTWTVVTGKTLPGNLYNSKVVVIGNNMYLLGGHNGSASVNSVYTATISDPTTWTTSASALPVGLNGALLTVIDNYVYLFGGYTTVATNAIYRAPLTHNRSNVFNKSWLTNWSTIASDQSNVTIGGTQATNINFSNATTITATTPSHVAGTADVVVTNYDGQSATLPAAFEYHNWITAGTYTSTVKPLANTGFGNIDWIAGTPVNTNLTMRVKSCTTADCSDKPSWTGCDLTAFDNGGDISGKGCVIDGQGFVQYQAYLSTDSAGAQPYLDSVTIATQVAYSTTFLNLISSPFDSGNENNSVQKISWSAVQDTTEGQVAMQIRTAPDNGGVADFTNSVWCGPTDCSATLNSTSDFATSYYTDKTGAQAVNNINKDLSNDQWIQYATFLKSTDGTLTPTLTEVTTQYAFNIPPAIAIDTNPTNLTQNSDGTFSVPYTLSETYDDFGSIPHGTSGSPIKALLFYQPKNDITIEALTNVQTGLVTLGNPGGVAIPSQGSMLIDNELVTFDSVGTTGNQRNITARGAAFAASYPTTAISHLANSPVFFLASASIQTIDTLIETGAVGAQASVENTFIWNPRVDTNSNLNGNKLSDLVFKVAANDADSTNINNIGQSSVTTSQILDLENPKIKNITSSSADGKYNAGKNVDVTINFADNLGNAKNVTSTGAVTINLETGTNDYDCLISTITNASSASCTYQVQAGDESADLTAISVTGTIKDQFQNELSDFAIPAGQNIADSKDIVIDTTSPIVSNVVPVADAFVNSITSANGGSDIFYEAAEVLKTGSYIKFTSTAGADLNAQYLCTLQGSALNLGVHNNFEIKQDANNCVEVQSALSSGSVYTMQIYAIDEADNVSDQTIANITFDTTDPDVSITAPANDAFFNSIESSSDVSYSLSEQLQTGTYLTFTQTGGSADASSPRTCNLTGTQLTAGDHDNVDLNAACGGFSLVDGAIYAIDLHAKDLAENEGDATQKTNITFDQTAPTLTSFTSDKANVDPAMVWARLLMSKLFSLKH